MQSMHVLIGRMRRRNLLLLGEAHRYCRVTWWRNSLCRVSASCSSAIPSAAAIGSAPGTRMRAFDASFPRRAPPSMP
jgi:hypothetical protein